MANKKKKKLTPVQQEYQELAKKQRARQTPFKNCIRAFIVGGAICLLGQCIQEMFVHLAGFDEKKAGDPTVAVLIIISVTLTSIGVYDKIGQWAGAGTAVPVTGFANTMASAALDSRSEGLVLGVGANMFKVSGPVIVFGTVAAFIVGILHWIFIESTGGGS